ncbi:uncharacterized protein LOC124169335 [Ischnura elegans]|uniref:uncharacterized protein LOC124169335 n=1 Tax=Ischnura elegans TaxID=197161 RepID=UPI001ED8BAE5|nr:uncharacterized protein LOC124169335 [Ischnura elegans]
MVCLHLFFVCLYRVMAEKMFLVGEFDDNTVEVFPREWIWKCGKKVFWPRNMSMRKIEKAIMSSAPPEDHWKVCPLKRVLAQSDTFSNAKRKAARAEYTSSISDTEPEGERRSVKRPTRFLSVSEVEVPRRRTPSVSSVEESEEEPQGEAPTMSQVPVPEFPLEFGQQDLEIDGAGGEKTITLKEVMKVLHSINYQMKSMRATLLKQGQCKCTCRHGETEQLPKSTFSTILPINDEEAMNTLCLELRNESARENLVRELSYAAGSTEVHTARNMMKKLFTKYLCKQYSCCGKKGKKNLSSLPVYGCIENKFWFLSLYWIKVKHGLGYAY